MKTKVPENLVPKNKHIPPADKLFLNEHNNSVFWIKWDKRFLTSIVLVGTEECYYRASRGNNFNGSDVLQKWKDDNRISLDTYVSAMESIDALEKENQNTHSTNSFWK